MRNSTSLQYFAKLYANQFICFISSYNISISIEESYYLLEYTLSAIYGIECSWYTEGIRMYGDLSIGVLNNLVAFDDSLTYEERVALVQLANSYFVAYTGCAV